MSRVHPDPERGVPADSVRTSQQNLNFPSFSNLLICVVGSPYLAILVHVSESLKTSTQEGIFLTRNRRISSDMSRM